jgi:hypothetical protein
MKQEFDELLCARYPKLMVNRQKTMQETCMYWGFECGDGWFDILDQLMANIQKHIDLKERQGLSIPQVTVDQVKEKFGTLSFYYTGGDEYIFGLVSMASSMSGVTCEACGKPGKQTDGNWIKTRCEEHS